MPQRLLDLVSHWHIPAPAEQVWAALSDPLGWPDWWPAVTAVQAQQAWRAEGPPARWHLAWTAGGLFRGSLALDALEALPPERWRLRSLARPGPQGQPQQRWLTGECIWLLHPAAGHTVITHLWRLQQPAGPRAWLWPLAVPLLRGLHGRVMQHGALGLARHLGRPPGAVAPGLRA